MNLQTITVPIFQKSWDIFYSKSLKNFKPHFYVTFYSKSWWNWQQSHTKKWSLKLCTFQGRCTLQNKWSFCKTFWIWHWHPKPGLFKMVASRFTDLEKPSLLPSRERQRERMINLGLEERKTFCYFVEVFCPEASRVNIYDMLVRILSLNLETFLCKTIESVSIFQWVTVWCSWGNAICLCGPQTLQAF